MSKYPKELKKYLEDYEIMIKKDNEFLETDLKAQEIIKMIQIHVGWHNKFFSQFHYEFKDSFEITKKHVIFELSERIVEMINSMVILLQSLNDYSSRIVLRSIIEAISVYNLLTKSTDDLVEKYEEWIIRNIHKIEMVKYELLSDAGTLTEEQSLSHEEISRLYKDFLDKNKALAKNDYGWTYEIESKILNGAEIIKKYGKLYYYHYLKGNIYVHTTQMALILEDDLSRLYKNEISLFDLHKEGYTLIFSAFQTLYVGYMHIFETEIKKSERILILVKDYVKITDVSKSIFSKPKD